MGLSIESANVTGRERLRQRRRRSAQECWALAAVYDERRCFDGP
jgi:hypothetical protein